MRCSGGSISDGQLIRSVRRRDCQARRLRRPASSAGHEHERSLVVFPRVTAFPPLLERVDQASWSHRTSGGWCGGLTESRSARSRARIVVILQSACLMAIAMSTSRSLATRAGAGPYGLSSTSPGTWSPSRTAIAAMNQAIRARPSRCAARSGDAWLLRSRRHARPWPPSLVPASARSRSGGSGIWMGAAFSVAAPRERSRKDLEWVPHKQSFVRSPLSEQRHVASPGCR